MIGVATLVERQARDKGSHVAVICEGRRTSFADLDGKAAQVARALLDAGCRTGSRIAFCDLASENYYHILYGAAKARCVFVPLNWRLPSGEIAAILRDSEAEILFLGSGFLDLAEEVSRSCPGVARIVALNENGKNVLTFDQWLAAASASDTLPSPHPDDEVLQLYTSGTTGVGKGVVITNRISEAVIRQSSDAGWVDWTDKDRVLVSMPLFHVGGLNVGLVAATRGAQAFLSAKADIGVMLDHIEHDRITILFLAPTIIADVLKLAAERGSDLSSVRTIYYGASPISETLLSRAQNAFEGAGFVQLYGLTETGGSVAFLSAEAHRLGGRKLRSCGKPIPGTRIRTINAEGKDAGADEPGEIVISGPTVMKGYWQRPEQTEAALRGGWFRTGDIGYFDAEGYLYIHDRLNDMIVTGGENVYPAEVENVLAKHPAIAEVAVIGIPDERWGEAVKAVVALKPGAEASASDIIAFARAALAGYKTPKSVDFAPSLPKSAVGKLLRRELRTRYWEGRERAV